MKRGPEGDLHNAASPFDALPLELLPGIVGFTARPALALLSKGWLRGVTQGGVDWLEIFSCEAESLGHHALLLLLPSGQLENVFMRDYVREVRVLSQGQAPQLRQRLGLFLMRALSVFRNLATTVEIRREFMLQSALYYVRDALQRPLVLRNFHPRDFRINFFEEGHTYFLTVCNAASEATALALNVRLPLISVWSNYLLSVTTLIHELFPPFVEDVAIENMMRSPKWTDPVKNRYFGMTPAQIKLAWQEARELGTAMHANIENYYNGLPYETVGREWELFTAFERDWVTGWLRPYRTEWLIYSEALRLTGSVDMLYEYADEERNKPDKDGKRHLVLMDWKRAVDLLEPNCYESGSHPATEDMSNCKVCHYTVQLQLYKMLLEANYNVVIDSMSIVGLHPSQENYIKYDVAWEPKRMRLIVAHRKSCIAKQATTG
jgi:hypothetical protein